MAQLENMIKKEVNITAAWEKEMLKLAIDHVKKFGWQNIDELKKKIAERIPKFAVESLKLGVQWIQKEGNV